MLRTLQRSFSQQKQRVLDSLGLRLKTSIPQEESLDILQASEKVTVKLAAAKLKEVPTYEDTMTFLGSVDEKVELPPRLDQINKETDVVRSWLENFDSKSKELIDAFEDPGPKGVYWFSEEGSNQESEMVNSADFYPLMNKLKSKEKLLDISEEDFVKLIRNTPESDYKLYPGTKKGPNPEDDLDAWGKWYLENQPSNVLAASGGEWDPMIELQEDEPELELESADNSVHSDPRQIFLESEFDAHAYFKQNPEADLFEGQSDINTIASYAPTEIEGMLPLLPKELPPDLIGFHESMNNWMSFRFVPLYFTHFPEMRRIYDEISQQKIETITTIPSPLNYFETLPKWYKDHRLVQASTVLLDKYHPLMPRKKKELFLNKLCNFLTPRSPEKFMFLQEYFIKAEIPEMALKGAEKLGTGELQFNITPKEEEVDEITKLLEESEEDEELLVNEKMKRMLGEDTVVKNEVIYAPEEIPDYGIDWFDYDTENPKGKIPCTLTYYDNDDGYWNDWIKVKRERIGMPEISVRKFFKH